MQGSKEQDFKSEAESNWHAGWKGGTHLADDDTKVEPDTLWLESGMILQIMGPADLAEFFHSLFASQRNTVLTTRANKHWLVGPQSETLARVHLTF